MAEPTDDEMINWLRQDIWWKEHRGWPDNDIAMARAVLARLEASRWRPIAYRVPVERHIAIAERDEGKWAIFDGACCLNIEGEWEVEPQPSSRTDGFKLRTRFSLSDAMRRAAEHFSLSPPATTSEDT